MEILGFSLGTVNAPFCESVGQASRLSLTLKLPLWRYVHPTFARTYTRWPLDKYSLQNSRPIVTFFPERGVTMGSVMWKVALLANRNEQTEYNMKKSFALILGLVLCGLLAIAPMANAATTDAKKPSGKQTPGVELAQTLSMVTGVAISPLLGVGAVGAWKYAQAKTPEQKAKLPWFAQPWFWVPALILVAFIGAKDIFGTAAPTALKKPFDIAETIENKISGLVVAGAFVPLVASIFGEFDESGALLSSMGLAAIDVSWLGNLITVPIAMVIFLFVWLLGHAVNVLILLSPFTTVDTALKSARLALMASVPATSWIDPWFGALWALVIIGVAYFVAGWTFRLSHFGTIFVWDYFTFGSRRFTVDKTANPMFLSRAVDKVPIRTYGKLSRNADGKLVLTYRPWLVLPARTLELPEGHYETGRGVFYSEVRYGVGDDSRAVFLLPPRYLGHETELAEVYKFYGVRDVGIRAAWNWLKGVFGFKPQPVIASA
jgi:MFS family permease